MFVFVVIWEKYGSQYIDVFVDEKAAYAFAKTHNGDVFGRVIS